MSNCKTSIACISILEAAGMVRFANTRRISALVALVITIYNGSINGDTVATRIITNLAI